jgi:hypothetical protein
MKVGVIALQPDMYDVVFWIFCRTGAKIKERFCRLNRIKYGKERTTRTRKKVKGTQREGRIPLSSRHAGIAVLKGKGMMTRGSAHAEEGRRERREGVSNGERGPVTDCDQAGSGSAAVGLDFGRLHHGRNERFVSFGSLI